MAKSSQAPLYNVIMSAEEHEVFSGRPEKIPYIINSCKENLPKFCLDMLFKGIFVPVLFFNVAGTMPVGAFVVAIIVWLLYLCPTLAMLKIPFEKAKEYKNIFYIVTDKAIYIQFGTKQIYYRIYPNDRIGTRVFYRQNRIDNIFNVGTLGFSVDDYYEERFVSVKNYEWLYNVLKQVTNSRREELQRIQEEREAKKREFEEQAKLVAQEALFLQQQEEEEERKRRERYEREMQEHFERERAEHERYMKEREERAKAREEERRRREEEADGDDEERFSQFRERNKRRRDEEPEHINRPEDIDSYDMYGAEIEDRPPSEKTIANYRSKYAAPSLEAHRQRAASRQGRRSIKNRTEDSASTAQANNALDMNKLWANVSDDDDDE